jgi:Calcineurin-like phosphoesterase
MAENRRKHRSMRHHAFSRHALRVEIQGCLNLGVPQQLLNSFCVCAASHQKSYREETSTLRLAILSDTHEQHRDVDLPAVDLLIHAGDWTFFSKRMKAVEDFNDWLAEQPIRHKTVLVPGNHEFYLEADPPRRSLTDNATVLIGERLSVEGLNLWVPQ